MVAKKPRVIIVGAGVAGLTAARRLCAAGGGDRFEVAVVEAGARAGGRVLTFEFAGHRVEMGATWVQGVDGSPVYALARDAGALGGRRGNKDDDGDRDAVGFLPYERMDGFPDRVLTVAEGGEVVDADRVARPVEELYRGMMEAARAGEARGGGGVEEYLRRGLRAYQAARPAAAEGGANKELEEVEEALLAMHINRERTDTSADDLGNLDLAAEGEYRDFPGEHVTIPGGYSRVVDHLVAALPPGTVRFGLRLRRLDWTGAPVLLHFADGPPAMTADHVILTVSLGVLKGSLGCKDASAAAAITFDPPLPQFKREAVARLGFGAVNKLFMEVEPAEAPGPDGGGGGDGQPPQFPFLHMAFRGHVAKIPWWMRGTESICPVHAGSRVALAWFAGREAEHLESLPDDEVIRGLHATLDSFLPGPPRWRVKRIKRSGWATDPLFMGSYSYVAVGSSGKDLDRMAEPLPSGPCADDSRAPPQPRLLFAGEATHRTHYSTTHAAYLSGLREAERLLQHYR